MPQSHSGRFRVDPASWPARGVPDVDRDELAPIRRIVYHCPRGTHEFTVPFADDDEVKIPDAWRCRHHGVECAQAGQEDLQPPPPEPGRLGGSDGRTHWDRLLERRSVHDLHVLLNERLAELGSEGLGPPPAPVSKASNTAAHR